MMCGFLATNRPITDFAEVNYFLELRGPDATTTLEVESFSFVHNLLSITGAFTRQPFTDGGIVCLYNGQVYNYEDLSNGRARSDGEILIPLYRKHGPCFVEELDGEFAVALFDFEDRIVILSSDVFATKPLWLARSAGYFGVSSYASALRRLGFAADETEKIRGNCARVVNLDSFADVDRFTLFDFDAAHQVKDHYEDWIAAFQRSIRRRSADLRERIFIGLSSGYDSGAIACELQEQGRPFNAYSILAQENPNVLRKRHQRLPGAKLLELSAESYAEAQEYVKGYCEEFQYRIERDGRVTPDEYMSEDKGAVGLAHICSLARRDGAKVYLSGQGADEIYSDYGCGGRRIYTHSTLGGRFPADLASRFPWPNFYDSTQVSYLAKEEHVAGGYGLETRYPYLDKHLVQEFLWLRCDLKNRHYKAPLHEYLRRKAFPFDVNRKVGFSCDRNLR